jgi:acetyl esterase
VLRDEAERYAAKLAAAGVEVEIVCWPGQIHGFLLEQGVNPAATAAITRAGNSLAAALRQLDR